MKRSLWSSAVVPAVALASLTAHADPSEPPAQGQAEEEEVVVDVTTAVSQLPMLLIIAATERDQELADEIRKQIEFTGLFATPSPKSLGLKPGLPDRNRWPGLAQAAVLVEREARAEPQFPVARTSTHLRNLRDEIRRREMTEYPGTSAMTAPVLADAIMEDVLGVRSHMSGKLLVTDATTRGERAIRVLSPDGQRNRRISGFGSLARGGDFGPNGTVYFASEDPSGKLALFREGQSKPVQLSVPGYVQSIAFAPDARSVVVSMGQGNVVQSWSGPSLDQLRLVTVGTDRTALSPSVASDGDVVHAVGPTAGPMSVVVGSKTVTPPGIWAAQPAFCSTRTERRVVYMVRAGAHWDVRITSLSNGLTRTVAHGMAPACSPDGRTVAFWALGRTLKGPGIYTVGDEGGMPRKVWTGEASGLRWREGEPLPPSRVDKVAAAAPAPR